jgi:hypothetical protein
MLRRILAIAAGIVVFLAVVAALDGVKTLLFPPPPNVDASNPDALRDLAANAPVAALAIVIAGSTLGALAAAYVSGILIGGNATFWPYITGTVALLATLTNALRLPHPLWFVAAAPLGVVAATVLGAWLAARMSRGRLPARTPAPAKPQGKRQAS